MNGGRFPDAQPVEKPAGAPFLGTRVGMEKELGSVGLEGVEVSEDRCEVRLPDAAAVVAQVEASLRNPFMQAVEQKLAAERWAELQEELRAALAGLTLDDGTTGYYIESLIGCGRKPL